MATEEAKDIQRRMYEFIVKYIKTEGMPPTNREIGREMNIASTGHVDYYLTMLEKQGLISRQQKKSRGIRLLLRSPLIHKVTVIGSIIGGQSLETFSEPNGHINVEADLAQKGNYALLVKGNSMIDEGIHDGDYVVIDPQFPYENGDIIVALHLQEGTMDSPTIKRFYREKEQNRIRLEPVNSELNLIYIPMSKWDHEWQIQGKVLAIVRQSNSEKENPALSTYPSGSTAEKDVEATITALRDATNKLNELINQKTAELLSAKQISSEIGGQNAKEYSKAEPKPIASEKDIEIVKIAQRVVDLAAQQEAAYERITTSAKSTREQLNQIYEQGHSQAKRWFLLSLVAAFIGFLVIIGVVISIFATNVAGILTSLASIIPTAVGVLFFQQAKEANIRLDDFYGKLIEQEEINQAVELSLTASDEVQDRYKGLIIFRLLGLHTQGQEIPILDIVANTQLMGELTVPKKESRETN